MHSRNIYKTPPEFSKLVKLCPDFSKVAKAVSSCVFENVISDTICK